MPSMTLLNQTGDVTITWDEKYEAEMRELIKKKIEEGYVFFIVKRKMLGLLKTKEQVVSIDQVKKGVDLLLKDEDAIALFSAGKINVTKEHVSDFESEGSSKDVDRILKEDTLLVRPIAAG